MYATVGVSDTISLVLTGSLISVDFYCDYDNSLSGLARLNNSVTGVGPYTLVPTPGTGTNEVRALSIYNKGTAAITVTIGYYIGTGRQILLSITLPSSLTLTYTSDGDGWQVYSVIGDRL